MGNYAELPIELYDKEILEKIGNSLGKLVKIDFKTLAKERVRFLRICVQVETLKIIPKVVWVGKIKQQILAQDTSLFCKMCKSYGHSTIQCKRNGLGDVQRRKESNS